MLRVREQHKESLISQEELLNEMEAVNRMTEREKKVEEEKRKIREKELQTQVSIMFVFTWNALCRYERVYTARNAQVGAILLQDCVALLSSSPYLDTFAPLAPARQ